MNDKNYAASGYAAHFEESVILWLFIIGALLGGMAANVTLYNYSGGELAMWLHLSVTIASGLLTGVLLVWLRSHLKALAMLAASLAVTGAVAWLLWDAF